MRIVLKDEGDRPLRREGSSSETEGSVLKHPRIKAKRRQGIQAGRRKDRSPILFSTDCQRPLKKEICTAGLKAAMPTAMPAKGCYADRKLLVFYTHEVELATLKGRVKLSPKNRQLKET